jgi:hypothetical protein
MKANYKRLYRVVLTGLGTLQQCRSSKLVYVTYFEDGFGLISETIQVGGSDEVS